MDSTTDEADNVPFDDDPKEFDTTVTMNNIAYSLHVNYRSLNDNQIKQRVWYSTQQGADTPGVFVTSNREIEIAIHKGGQLLVDTRIRKETLRLSDESLATEMLGAPSYLRTQDGLLVFGVPIGELDSEESSWVEFGIDTTGKVSVLSQISET